MLDNLPLISIPLPMPISSLGEINVYLVMANPITLIDTGLRYRESSEVLYRTLENRGINIHSIKRILITHGHPDHFGLARELQEKCGAEVLIRVEDLPKVSTDYRLFKNNRDLLAMAGIPASSVEVITNLEMVMGHFREPLDRVNTFDGEPEIEFDGFSLKTLHLPGHSAGHTCFYWREKRLLFSGDMVLPQITTIPVVEYQDGEGNGRSPSLQQMLNSLERLYSLEIDYILPGHGEIVYGARELIGSRIVFYRQRLEEIYALLQSTGPQNAYELAMRYFSWVEGFDVLLAVCETIVNLDLLIEQGRAREELLQGASQFSAL